MNRIMKSLLSPWAIMISVVVGGLIGFTNKSLADLIGPAGQVYLNILKMCILPFLVSAIMINVASLLRSESALQYLRRICLVFVIGMFFAGVVGSFGGALFLSAGKEGDAAKKLGRMINKNGSSNDLEMALFEPPAPQPKQGSSLDAIAGVVPENVFRALSDGNSLQVLVFALIFGIALGMISKETSRGFTQTAQAIYSACQHIIKWVNVLLPFALCAMVAQQVARVGAEPILAMLNFLIVFTIVTIVFIAVCVAVIWRRSQRPFTDTLRALREPFFLAIGTRSSLACIPTTIEALSASLGFQRSATDLVVPLSMTICRVGPILFYAVGTVFMARIYEVPLGLPELITVASMSVLAGIASAGATGVATLTLMSLVFGPLQIPFETALVLFIAIDPATDVLRTATLVIGNCASASLIAEQTTVIKALERQAA